MSQPLDGWETAALINCIRERIEGVEALCRTAMDDTEEYDSTYFLAEDVLRELGGRGVMMIKANHDYALRMCAHLARKGCAVPSSEIGGATGPNEYTESGNRSMERPLGAHVLHERSRRRRLYGAR